MKYIRVFKLCSVDKSISLKPSGLKNDSFEECYVKYDKREIFESSVDIYKQSAEHGYGFAKGLRSKSDFDIIFGSCYIVYIQAYFQAKFFLDVLKEHDLKLIASGQIRIRKFNNSDHFFNAFFAENYWFYLLNVIDNLLPKREERIPLNFDNFDSRKKISRITLRLLGFLSFGGHVSNQFIWSNSERSIIETSFLKLLNNDFGKSGTSITGGETIHSENLFWNSSVLKRKILRANELVTYQHGGNIGLYEYNTFHWYQNLVSSRSFYWFDDSDFKFNKGLTVSHANYSCLSVLIVLVSVPRYNYYIHGFPLSDCYFDFLQFSVEVAELFGTGRVMFRPYHEDYGWGTDDFLQRKGYSLCTDDFKDSLMKHPLRIISYNATAWLQSLEIGPTVLLMHDSISEYSERWEQVFSRMKEVGLIIHPGNINKLKTLTTLDIIFDWWNSPEVEAARKSFMNMYMYND